MLFGILFFMSYVAGTNSFPKPLTPDEERDILEKYAHGDTEARNILIERNLRLVAHIAKKYNNHSKDSEDLISVGTIGLIKAITTFNSSKGTKLATYAARCIDNEILMCLRSNKKFDNDVYLQEPIGVDKEGNEVTMEDKLAEITTSSLIQCGRDLLVYAITCPKSDYDKAIFLTKHSTSENRIRSCSNLTPSPQWFDCRLHTRSCSCCVKHFISAKYGLSSLLHSER